MHEIPDVTTLDEVVKREAFQALEPIVRPAYWGVDLDRARRPGVPMAKPPRPMPHARFPITPMEGTPSTPMHGRPNKTFPPVFSTAIPLKGLSGVIRRFAASFPDHKPHHWLLKMLSDRVDAAEYRLGKLAPYALPAAGLLLLARRLR